MMDGGTRAFSSGTSTEGAKSKKTGPLPDVLLLEHLKNAKTMSEEDIREEVATFMFAVCEMFWFFPSMTILLDVPLSQECSKFANDGTAAMVLFVHLQLPPLRQMPPIKTVIIQK